MKNLIIMIIAIGILLFYVNSYPQNNQHKIALPSPGITQGISTDQDVLISSRIGTPLLGSSANTLITVRSGIKLWKNDKLNPGILAQGMVQSPLVKKFKLYENYPNPFNPSTKIKYEIPEPSFISVKVYDILGNEIITLVNKERPAGIYEAEFIARDLSSGIYFYRLQSAKYVETKRMLLLK